MKKDGTGIDALRSELKQAATGDADWKSGKLWSLVYNAGDEVMEVQRMAQDIFLSANALSPIAFPSLRRFETEVLQMVAELLGKPDAVGSMTCGGSESVLMAVKTARDFMARDNPEMVLPRSAHPAFHKAAQYFGVKAVPVDLGPDLRVDMKQFRAAVSDRTILVVGSAPTYPHGVVDPIPEIAAIALERKILCHVDACLGGMFLPFMDAAPPFDFRVPGVTSMSCDLHKYGYTARGASTVLYKDRALRRAQFFAHPDYPGGLYSSPTMTGSRPGGPIAAAWAVMRYLGRDGYVKLNKAAMSAAKALQAGVRSIPGMRVLGEPVMSVFAFTSDTIDIYAVCEKMHERGWEVQRQQQPPSAHLLVTPAHGAVVDHFLDDLRAVAKELAGSGPTAEGAAAMYGMLGTTPDRTMVKEFILDFQDGLDA